MDFLVLGAGRGGTSLLATALDAHPDLTVGFEQWAVAVLMGGSPPWATRSASERLDGFLDACRSEAWLASTERWGNKITTEQLAAVLPDRLAVEASLRGPFSQIPIVAITRDGRSCVASKMRRAGVSFEEACRRWLFSIDVVDALEKSGENHYVLKYEDLVRQPRETLEAVCAFLGVRFHPAALTGTASEQMPVEYRREGFDVSAVAPPSELPPAWMDLLGPALAARGYL